MIVGTNTVYHYCLHTIMSNENVFILLKISHWHFKKSKYSSIYLNNYKISVHYYKFHHLNTYTHQYLC